MGVRDAHAGKHDGAQVEGYLRTVGLGKGYPYCAAFVKWCLLQAKVSAASQIDGAAASTFRKGHLVYYQSKFDSVPLPGDVFCLYYNSLHRIGHTGFWGGWANKNAGTVITVEGNTNNNGSRQGDGVYRRIRQQGAMYSVSRWVY